jgi:WD40 repeat protein
MLKADDSPQPPGLVATLKGHTDTVYAIDFSPDGRFVLTGSGDKTLKLWNVKYQREVHTYGSGPNGHQQLVLAATFSPNGFRIASAGSDNAARIWFSRSSGELPHLASVYASLFPIAEIYADIPPKNLAHPNIVDSIAFDPAGRQLATGCHDGAVRIWDVATGKQVREIKAHVTPAAAAVYCVAWTADGKEILSGSFDRSMKLWNASDGKLIREFKGYKEKESEKGHRDGIFSLAISPDGKLVVSGSSDRSIKLWNMADAKVVRELVQPTPVPGGGTTATALYPVAHPGWVYSVKFTRDGRHVVSAGNAPRNKGYLAVWRVADGKQVYGQEWAHGPIYSAAVSPDGTLLALACGPADRHSPDANAYIVKMPELHDRAVSKVGK